MFDQTQLKEIELITKTNEELKLQKKRYCTKKQMSQPNQPLGKYESWNENLAMNANYRFKWTFGG